MYTRVVLFCLAVLAFALLATANPVPAREGTLAKKALKQYDVRRGVAAKRDGYGPSKRAEAAYPSKTYRALPREPTMM